MGISVINGASPTVVDAETQSSILYYLVGKLNDSNILPVSIGVSSLNKSSESSCVVVEKTPLKLKQYVDGSYEGSMVVSLYYRSVAVSASSERLNILYMLNKFNSYLHLLDTSDFTICEIESLEQSELSSLIAKYDNSIEDYGIKITLKYTSE